MTECSISIVIPAYNVEKYLGDALDSIQAQDISPDEVILIDDGSNDRTLEIANSYVFAMPYTVLSIKNSGQGHARNIGLNLASSEYIYFFDSDDILSNDFISSLKENIISNDLPDIVLFSGQSFDDKDYKGKRWVDYTRGFSGFFKSRVEFLNQGYSHKGLFCSPCLYASRRSIWNKNGLKFGENYLEDEAIFFPLLFSCQSFSVMNKVFFYRRNRDGSTMTMKPELRHVRGALDCLDRTIDLYRSHKWSKCEKWHLKKRLEGHCAVYLRIARAAKLEISYKLIFSVIRTTQSISLAAKALLYFVHADKSEAVRRAVTNIRGHLSR